MTTTTSAVVARPTRSLPAAALWTLGFLTFPVAGVAGTAVAGPLDAPVAALLGGLTTGAVIGLGQALVSTRRLAVLRWTFATAVGTAAGLLLGASTVSYATGLADLAVMGALTGAVLGPVQALALPARARHRWIWAAAMPPVWAAGWSVTAAAGIAVEEQFMVFGASGALTATVLLAGCLHLLLPPTASTPSGPTAPTVAIRGRS